MSVAMIPQSSRSDVTVTDLFCGAGGSSQGARKGGAIVKMAANHWRLAVETHQTNFPDTDHDCADISQCDPRRYPRTNILIASPECVNHTSAKGVSRARQQTSLFGDAPDPGAERSRATMWDVPRFAERHHYEIVIVENVVEARQWVMWDAWIHAMRLLGYDYRAVFFNSMFAYPTPQSRDRMYVVFWRQGNTAPRLDITPRAYCPRCACDVAAVQSWKSGRTAGRYRKQYVYCCPRCALVIEPYYFAAANAIDWKLPAPRIGDRTRPLREKTLARIQAGLERFASGRYQASPFALYDAGVPAHVRAALAPAAEAAPYTFSMGAWDTMFRRADEALPAQTSSRSNGLVTPPFQLGIGTWDDGATRALDAPADPQTTKRLDGVVMPFVCEVSHGGAEHAGRIKPANAPISAQTTLGDSAVVMVPFAVPLAHEGIESKAARAVGESLPTQTARQETGLAVAPFIPFIAELRTHNTASSTGDPLATVVAGGNHHLLVEPPPSAFTVAYYGTDQSAHPLDDALGAQSSHDRHAMVAPRSRVAAQPPALEDCGFRVLAPHEVQRAMAFEPDYVVLGTQRDKVRQLGNAVTPPVMELLIERCLATLRGEGVR